MAPKYVHGGAAVNGMKVPAHRACVPVGMTESRSTWTGWAVGLLGSGVVKEDSGVKGGAIM